MSLTFFVPLDFTFHVFHHVFHLLHFSQKFAVGVAGFHYQQVTGDSGAGATLGAFKGRVTALGPVMTYNFNLGKIPVSTQLTWMHDFRKKAWRLI